jgi:glycosyltransferase involved in cell wall biosynthesis
MNPGSGNLVSVIMPAYNAEKYIGEAIESVLKQTYPYFELIVVDDGSADRTAEIVKSFKDERINLIMHKCNRGVSEARNSALYSAKGNWIALHNADDKWLPGRLEKLMEIVLTSGDNYFVADDLTLCFDTPNGLKEWGSLLKIDYGIKPDGKIMELSMTDYLKLGSPGINPIIPLHHIKVHNLRYKPALKVAEDFEFYCNLFRVGLKLKLYKKAFYLYRLNPDSITGQFNASQGLAIKLLSADENFSYEERTLFKSYIRKSETELKYRKFSYSLKKKEFYKAFLLILKDPTLLLKLIIRLPRSLRYRITAKLYGANIK